LFFKKGQQIGDVLTGGIKRKDVISNLNVLLSHERAEQLKNTIKNTEETCDVLILGGGPAGLTAAVYAAQAKLKTIVADISMPGGQVSTTHLVSNFPGFAEPVNGYMLAHHMFQQAKNAGAVFRSAVDISDIDLEHKTIMIDGYEKITAENIIIATGSSPRLLSLPGEIEYKGKGISYCATCDGKYYDGKEIIVIGGGNSAIEESLFLSQFASKITIIHQFDHLQANKEAQEKVFADPKIQFLFEHEPREFIKNNDSSMTIKAESLKDGTFKTVSAAGVFVFVGMKPNLDDFADLLERDSWGYLKVDNSFQTNINRVYAAGDVVTKEIRQITTAVSDGTIAAVSIVKNTV
jgi:thioredoxin reductase (NADPH)